MLVSSGYETYNTAKPGRYYNNYTSYKRLSTCWIQFSIYTGKVGGYRSGWKPDRPFAIDMAGFGINLDLILSKSESEFSYKMTKGYQESDFLSYFVTKDELEPLADNCTKVYVWHTRTELPSIKGYIPNMEV